MKAIAVAELKAFVLQVLAKCGVGEKDAETTAEILVTTDTWGVYTHGTKALYAYARRLRAQGLKPRGRPRVQKEGPAWALVDGDSSLGMVTGVFAMKLAIAKANVPELKLLIGQTEDQLSVLLGHNPQGLTRNEDSAAAQSLDRTPAPVPAAGLPSSLLERRPDVREAEQNLVAAHRGT